MDDIDAFFLVGNDECDVKNPSPGTMAKEYQIAGLHFLKGYFDPFDGLGAGACRKCDIEILHNKMRES